MPKVSFLPQKHIENATLDLLAAYGYQYQAITTPPVPIEEILEAHLGLALDFDAMAERFGAPDVLGAMWVNDRQVLIDESLDPETYPARQGRYRFTLSHEIGHWALHRHYFLADAEQSKMFSDGAQPSIVCRTRSAKEPIEWQADAFAGFLLMPGELVKRAWHEQHGTLEPYVAKDEIADLSARWRLAENAQPTVRVARDMARLFEVSGQAMQIRLIGLGLIQTEAPAPGLFSA